MSMLVLRILVNVVPFSIVGGYGKKKLDPPPQTRIFSKTYYLSEISPPSNMYFYLKKMLPSSPNIDFHMFPAQSYNAKGCPFNTIEWGREAKIFDPFPSNIDFFPKIFLPLLPQHGFQLLRDGSLFKGRGAEIFIFEAAKKKCPPPLEIFFRKFF